MSSNAISMTVIGNMGNIYIDTKVIEVMEHHMLIFHGPCRRRSIGPLPSCYYPGLRNLIRVSALPTNVSVSIYLSRRRRVEMASAVKSNQWAVV